jgi:cytosine/adenosine deaminase-related metal-dependent hydrolase
VSEVYRARWVLPIESPPIEDGAIAVEAGRIAAVAPASEIGGAAVNDCGDSILLPGFVNPHAHLELSCYRGRLQPAPLWSWFEELMKLIYGSTGPKPGPDSVLAGAAESLAAGVTCIGDISRTGVQVDALRGSPIRKVCFLELISGATFPPNDAHSLEAMLDRMAGFSQPDRLTVGISPHTLYTVPWDDLLACADLARRRDVPLTIHLAETVEEVDWLASGGGHLGGLLDQWRLPCRFSAIRGTPVGVIQRAGVLSVAPLLAHVNYCDDADLALLSKSRASVVWCPRSHRFFGHAAHRWQDMLAAGVNVCVGTDSLASNQTLSILDELRFVRRQFPDVPPQTLLELGTSRAAKGLRLAHSVGGLRPGKLADFVTIPWEAGGPSEPAANLLEGARPVGGIWIGGARYVKP